MLPVLIFPQINPVLIQLGPFAIRWYALAYIVGLLVGWRLVRYLVRLFPAVATRLQVDDFLTWATLGVVLGGRLGYVLFYQPSFYLSHPVAALQVWHGGMSFHGGALGVILALVLFTRRHALSFLAFSDRVVVAVPIGLGLGRIANFINGELWGREAPDSLPWAMIFPHAGAVARHPSELYEALLEGAMLFIVLCVLAGRRRIRSLPGFLSGAFLLGYAVARSFSECFREPDAFLGFLPFGLTMGQVLCIPMAVAGVALICYARAHPPLEQRVSEEGSSAASQRQDR